jgi:hypothetical protein
MPWAAPTKGRAASQKRAMIILPSCWSKILTTSLIWGFPKAADNYLPD